MYISVTSSRNTSNMVRPSPTENFLRHSLAHLGSSQVEATATMESFHLGSVFSSWRMFLTSPRRCTMVPLLSDNVPSLFCLKGDPPPHSSYISGSQQQPSRSNTTTLGNMALTRLTRRVGNDI